MKYQLNKVEKIEEVSPEEIKSEYNVVLLDKDNLPRIASIRDNKDNINNDKDSVNNNNKDNKDSSEFDENKDRKNEKMIFIESID